VKFCIAGIHSFRCLITTFACGKLLVAHLRESQKQLSSSISPISYLVEIRARNSSLAFLFQSRQPAEAMADENKTPFTTLLRADSEHAQQDNDSEATTALGKYGVVFDERNQRRPDPTRRCA
jgi:hypothetical protein